MSSAYTEEYETEHELSRYGVGFPTRVVEPPGGHLKLCVCLPIRWKIIQNHRVASARWTKAAASSASRSRAKRPTTCTPSGKPAESKSPGTLTQGVPKSVQSRLKVGLPVELNPCGAAPGADGVRSTSMPSMKSTKARRACRARRRASS